MRIDQTGLLLIFLAVAIVVGLRKTRLSTDHAPSVDTGSPERSSPLIPTTLDEATQCLVDDWYKGNGSSQF